MENKLEIRKQQFDQIDLYPVITSEFCAGRSSLEVVRQVLAGGAKIIQLREKQMAKKDLFELAQKVKLLADRHKALVIINDYIDIALAINADGVHLGQDDLPLSAAKKIAPQLIIGVSTHNLAEAKLAQLAYADYINIGPIFSTQTKAHLSTALGLEGFKEIASQVALPYTVMGGMKQHNIDQVLEAGATKIAMITAITQAANISESVQSIRRRINDYNGTN